MADLSIVYVLTNPAMPGLVKIGMTGSSDADERVAQLYTSGVPFPFKLEFACRVANPAEVESALHRAFAPNRVNPKREFFKIEPDQAIAILKLLDNASDVTASVKAETEQAAVADVAAGEAYERTRRPNLNFIEMQIPIGSVLVSTVDQTTATVVGPKKVGLNGEEMFLTAATRKVLGTDYSVAPAPYWTFNGRKLSDIYEETYPASDD
jgi:hypothetical protein